LGKVEHKMAALGALVELDESTWLNQAPAFTCMEADVVARFLTAWKEPGIAGDFLERHALDDDEGDDHYALRVAVEAATE
jgi:hypothetical protein